MPRHSLQWILDHQDELADTAEAFEPTEAQLARGGEMSDLHHAVRAAGDAERAIVNAIIAARAKGAPWEEIGTILGTTGEAARQRYGKTVSAA